ncbi:MAG: DUF4493 domain-containing protein [Bacteroidales bacterium]|nr:DUF4493 domain-containing protein [Bacteroidales bacterium]
MKKLLISVLAIVAMVGCKKTVIDSPSDQFGYVRLNLSTDTEMTVVTKADLTPEELGTFNVTLHNSTGPIATKEYSEISESGWAVSAGIYNVYVENLTDAEATPEGDKGTVRVGCLVEDVSVAAGVPTEVTANCTPINSRVTVAYGENFETVFDEPVVNIAGGTRSFDMTWGHDIANSVYYPAGTELTWTLNAKLAGVDKMYNSTNPIMTQSGKWTQVTFSASTTDGSINVTINVSDDFGEPVQVFESINPFE